MLAYVAPIVVFGLVIFVHELGHFIAAKLVGVYAPRFSIGFGPALFRLRRGEKLKACDDLSLAKALGDVPDVDQLIQENCAGMDQRKR